MKSKSLKITSITVRSTWSSTDYPKISIQGKWVKELGFSIGGHVDVHFEKNMIIIKKREV